MNQNSPNNIFKNCKNSIFLYTNSMPLFIKCVVCSTVTLYLINLLIPFTSKCLANIPYYTIYYLQLWRLITDSFITTNILSIIFSFIIWYKKAVNLEKEIGSTKYMIIFLMNTICIQFIYCFIMYLLSFPFSNRMLLIKLTYDGVRNDGLWPIIICDITLLCLSNQEENMKFYLIPFVIKAKYYPLILFGIFFVVGGFRIELEILCGIGYGFLYHYYLKNRLSLSNNFVVKIENCALFKSMKNKKGFIGVGGVGPFELHNNLENMRNVRINRSEETTERNSDAFSGKGITIGSSENNENLSNTDNILNNPDNNKDATVISTGESNSEGNSAEIKP